MSIQQYLNCRKDAVKIKQKLDRKKKEHSEFLKQLVEKEEAKFELESMHLQKEYMEAKEHIAKLKVQAEMYVKSTISKIVLDDSLSTQDKQEKIQSIKTKYLSQINPKDEYSHYEQHSVDLLESFIRTLPFVQYQNGRRNCHPEQQSDPHKSSLGFDFNGKLEEAYYPNNIPYPSKHYNNTRNRLDRPHNSNESYRIEDSLSRDTNIQELD